MYLFSLEVRQMFFTKENQFKVFQIFRHYEAKIWRRGSLRFIIKDLKKNTTLIF